MSSRKLSALEQKIHQAVLTSPNSSLSQKELDALAPDAQARTAALNFLLGTGMFKALADAKGRMMYRAVVKKEVDAKKDMSGEESMVLGHIQAAANEGIWTKHIKAKTELHQTIIDRCLKSLVQKQLVKAVKSVKFPTRKIYMLFHLDPSVEMTGGPWYTDNELDTEFIKLLSRACLQFVKDRSFPRARKHTDEDDAPSRQFYSISAAPSYPSSQQVQAFLAKSKITETELTVEHVEMLLNVLVLDGDVERIPAFGAALWSSNVGSIGDDEDDDSDTEQDRKKKRRKKDKERGREKDVDRKRKRRADADNEDRNGNANEDSDVDSGKTASKKGKGKKSRHSSDTESDQSSDSDHGRKKKSKSKRRRKHDSDSSDSDDGVERSRKKESKSKSRKRRAAPPSDSSSETLDSDSSSSEDDSRSRRKKRSKSRTSKSSRSRRSHSPSGLPASAVYGGADGLGEAFGGAAYVYRAVHPERVGASRLSSFLGWGSQTPCARCPVFDFCKQGGPVNPTDCVYYGEWFDKGVVQIE